MHALHLTVALWVVAGGVGHVDVERPADLGEQLAHELLSTIRMDAFWDAIPSEDLPFQRPDRRIGSRPGHGEGLHPFGEGVATGEDVLRAGAVARRERSEEVDVEALKGVSDCRRNQRVSLVFLPALLGLASGAGRDEVVNLLLHGWEVDRPA